MLEIIHNSVYEFLLENANAALHSLDGRVVFSHEQSMDYRLCVEKFKSECCDRTDESSDAVEQGESQDLLPFIAIAKNPPQRHPDVLKYPGAKALVRKNITAGHPDYGKYVDTRFAVCYIEYDIRYYFGSEFDYNRIIEHFFLMYPANRAFFGIPIYFCEDEYIRCDIFFGEFDEIQKIDAGTLDTMRLYTLHQTWHVETHIIGMLGEGPLVLRPLVDFQAYKISSRFNVDAPEYAEEIDYSTTFKK